MVPDVKRHNLEKVQQCAKELVAGMHSGNVQAAMRVHGITHLGKLPVTKAMRVYQPHAAALRTQLLRPTPTPAPRLSASSGSPAASEASPANPAPAASAPATAGASNSTPSASAAPLPTTRVGRLRAAQLEFNGFALRGDQTNLQKRAAVAQLFDECASGTDVKRLAARLLAAAVQGANANLIAAAVRDHVQVHATKHLDAKTVAADRERYLAGSTAARGRQPSLGVGFDELLKSWVAVQRLHFKVPVTKERLLHHTKVILAGSGAKNRKGKLYEDAIDLHWVERWLKRTRADLTYTYNRALDANRARWCTPENIALHFVILAEVCVANGVAVWNKDFDYKDQESEMVYITHPALLMSFDETGKCPTHPATQPPPSAERAVRRDAGRMRARACACACVRGGWWW